MAKANIKSCAGEGFGKINLKAETHVVPTGRHHCTISDVRLIRSREEDTLWLTIALDVHTENGEVLGQVEEKFITIAARDGSRHQMRVREGLKRLALYADAVGVDLNDAEPDQIGGKLVGRRILAVISRYGVGVQAENRVVTVLKDGW